MLLSRPPSPTLQSLSESYVLPLLLSQPLTLSSLTTPAPSFSIFNHPPPVYHFAEDAAADEIGIQSRVASAA